MHLCMYALTPVCMYVCITNWLPAPNVCPLFFVLFFGGNSFPNSTLQHECLLVCPLVHISLLLSVPAIVLVSVSVSVAVSVAVNAAIGARWSARWSVPVGVPTECPLECPLSAH